MDKIKVAIVGLSFGLEFVPIYLDHPNVSKLVIVDRDKSLVGIAQNRYGIKDEDCYGDIEDVLGDSSIDAVHLVTPPATHAPFSINVLQAGKHCACTIPMGMSLPELEAVIKARIASGKNYMFMETTVYQRETLYVKECVEKGEFGEIQYMSCAHYQDMEGWPSYWHGYPPLMHSTHALGPCLVIADDVPVSVSAVGSGRIREELIKQYNSPFAFESAFVKLKNRNYVIKLERFLYGVARGYSECFRIFGSQKSFEWQQLEKELPVVFTRTLDPEHGTRGNKVVGAHVEAPDYADRLPKEIACYTRKTAYTSEISHLSFEQGGGHGGSHPHLVHEFVSSILEERMPSPSDIDGAYWTAAGICAHQSAMSGGKEIEIPNYNSL